MSTRRTLLDQKQLFITCVVPVRNEAEAIEAFLTQLQIALLQYSQVIEIIVIDDGSTDTSFDKIAALSEAIPQLKLLGLSRNFGKEKALTAGLDHACGDVVILIDADFQHPFSTLNEFLQHWAAGFDMVYGVRQDRDNETLTKKWLSHLFYRLTNQLNEVPIPKDAGDFRLLDAKVVKALKDCGERNRFMKGLYAWVGFKSKGIPFQVQDRQHGKSSWNFRRLLSLALDGIFSFSNLPLRVWSILGISISALSFIYALWIVFKTLYFGVDTPGFATLIVAIMFLGGLQLFSIGVLGEYIGRIFTEVKQRPNYIIARSVGLNESKQPD